MTTPKAVLDRKLLGALSDELRETVVWSCVYASALHHYGGGDSEVLRQLANDALAIWRSDVKR